MIRHLTLFFVGILFSIGLGIAGMTRPDRIIGFLTVGDGWDPTLLYVMGGAIAAYVVVFRLAMRRSKPVMAPKFLVPTRSDLDARLIGGAVLFGAGWGLGGLCPAPALAALPSGAAPAFVFIAAMLLGMWLFKQYDAWAARAKKSEKVTGGKPVLQS